MRYQQETQKNRGYHTSCLTQATTFLHFRLSVLYNKPNSCTYNTLNVLIVITNPENPTLNSLPVQIHRGFICIPRELVFFFFPSLNSFNPLVQAISFTNISCNQGLAHVVIFPLINQSILSVECFFPPYRHQRMTMLLQDHQQLDLVKERQSNLPDFALKMRKMGQIHKGLLSQNRKLDKPLLKLSQRRLGI